VEEIRRGIRVGAEGVARFVFICTAGLVPCCVDEEHYMEDIMNACPW
jgi:hypothetical protein